MTHKRETRRTRGFWFIHGSSRGPELPGAVRTGQETVLQPHMNASVSCKQVRLITRLPFELPSLRRRSNIYLGKCWV